MPIRKLHGNLVGMHNVAAIRRAKRHYFQSESIRQRKRGGVWKVINQSQKANIRELNVNGKSTSDKSAIANEFASFFQSKVDSLKRNANCKPIQDILSKFFNSSSSWDLRPCSVDEVSRCIDQLKPSKVVGPDGISNLLIKWLKFDLLPSVTALFNSCIFKGKFPALWKCARVTPVPKKGDRRETCNYRPVAIGSSVGKLLEKVIHLQISPVLENLLPSTMYGFRPGKSTETALVDVVECIKEKKAKGQRVAALGIDQSCAFDLQNHDIILTSLSALGAGPLMLSWTKDYLNGCKYYVDLDGTTSDPWWTDCGVGQGKILSTTLFNIGNLTQVFWSDGAVPNLFADDSLDILAANTDAELNSLIQTTANEKAQWFQHCGLSINEKKTELVGFFGFKPQDITINSTIIHAKQKLKYLGVTLQDDLKFNDHVNDVCRKLRCTAGRIRTFGQYFSIQDRRILLNGWARGSICSNGLAYLPFLPEYLLDKLEGAYNTCVRGVVGLPRYGQAPLTKIKKDLRIPSVRQLRLRTLQMAAWKGRSAFTSTSSGPITRARAKGNVPHPSLKGNPLSATLARQWNLLPMDIRNNDNVKTVSRKLSNLLTA